MGRWSPSLLFILHSLVPSSPQRQRQTPPALPAVVDAQTVDRAYVAQDGLVHIRYGRGDEWIAPREPLDPAASPSNDNPFQVSVVAGDHRTVAWLVDFSACCTSYPIPLRLVVFREGRIIQRFDDRAIFRFVFVHGGRQIAYYTDTLHGSSTAECVLRDVLTGKLLDKRMLGDRTPLPIWAEPFQSELAPEKQTPEP